MVFTETLTSGQTSNSFKVTTNNSRFPVNVSILGDLNSSSVHMEQSPDGTTWTDLYADASLVEFTTAGEQHALVPHPGFSYRFVAATVTSVVVQATGKYVRV